MVIRSECVGTITPSDHVTDREIRIHSNVLARLCKEHIFYQNEADKLTRKVEDLKGCGACTHEIRHMSEVRVESISMIPQVESQIRIAREKLNDVVNKYESQVPSESTARLLLDARQSLDRAKRVLGDEMNQSSTASPPAEEDPACSSSDEEY